MKFHNSLTLGEESISCIREGVDTGICGFHRSQIVQEGLRKSIYVISELTVREKHPVSECFVDVRYQSVVLIFILFLF
ncbi:hypothetical protein [Vibrio owensii]|uniref:hypothetical protein n=1 Tax=Vibrio owensii TaxID=696485 RepID=UPI0012D45211|nr:hypothetical protein [Vibrio owensii]